ncbi:TadE-like protein [Aquisphaera giovannonii]|uniref:TadE-like protein n=1 Tax=Aquisphaera giovannonii TaxID=406548 RepID=A0A5B9W5V4_9BACT|nr:TadE/TadG family type IV pilus assembly protein [Aquisphaera giovannonii]QEH35993.1 TadE-like protein [Aquisphaera giovannonii]
MIARGRGRKRRRGIAAVEAALTFPLLLTILVGLWEVGRLVEVKQVLVNAAREGGRQASIGTKTAAQIQADVLNYIRLDGLSTQGAGVTVTNLTSPSVVDPSQAAQLDRIRVTVTIPFDSVKLSLLNRVYAAPTLSASSEWKSMKDLPVDFSAVIPIY